MVGGALSERVKLQERRRVDNTIMQHAIDEYLRRKLTHAEERVLVDWILESSDRALPPSLANIAVHANRILGGREVPVEPASCYGKGSFTQ
ncbi:hypothetical protein K443DRAFT_109959 [Laccaria amethystina LaAM-08-1]|uniref:HTH CENPB-type domain-containing protein n=1 Tax=Laccaria amethystina LaAM-08-1 TaxID=1095629 RepID=A0A0C9WJH3_9AGAR|nr:hypothetical protein K443DRAFT_109959 [Laccaria amethystina LaAM-08-1]